MVKFLINRPIAVIMSFLAIIFLGIITSLNIPVSLMPSIDIPEITVQISYPNTPSREMENSIVKPIRQQMLQVGHLKDIESQTQDGHALIRLRFAYGTDINYAYIESNEKIDDAMNGMPRDLDRPRVIKSSASDIPVFNILVTREADWNDQKKSLELSEFVRSVVLRRIEQLPEVAMVDMTGMSWSELAVFPDYEKLRSLELTDQDILNSLEKNNITIGNLMVREGYYQYNIRFSNYLKNKADIENIYISAGDRLLQLKELAEFDLRPQSRSGLFQNRDKEGLCLAIIKQADARMEDLKIELDGLLTNYRENYPDLDFELEKDQTRILDVSIGNLRQSLFFGAVLAVLIMFLFLKDFRSPLLIAFSIPVSLIICFLVFYLAGISINIISLSGLVLAVGMMIDNSIIVIDNINQYIEKGEKLSVACIVGTNEVIRPLISSALTTSAVFIPLVFLSGISGALFFDQAVAVTTGLIVSFLVSITLLPMLFRLLYKGNKKVGANRFLLRINRINYEGSYEKGFNHFFRFKALYGILFLLFIAGGIFLVTFLEVRRLPKISEMETIALIDWNEPIHVNENADRIQKLVATLSDSLIQYSVLAGKQDFLLNRDADQTASEAEIYLRTTSTEAVIRIRDEFLSWLDSHYPQASASFHPPENIFEAIFSEDKPELVAELSDFRGNHIPELSALYDFLDNSEKLDKLEFESIPVDDQIIIEVDPELLLLYKVDFNSVYNQLSSAFNQRQIGLLKTYQRFIPIMMGENQRTVLDIIQQTIIKNKEGEELPLSSLVRTGKEQDYKTIRAGREGEYIPLVLRKSDEGPQSAMRKIRNRVKQSDGLEVSFSGTFFTQKDLMRELALVLLISVMLLYFILAAQFESFVQPLIVLLELPIDIAGAFFVLWLAGESLNIMSAIGIIVMSGIIINDSILKIDTINRARLSGESVLEAIKTGGRRRLKPILMTSLTTILALTPFLFFKGLGAELQRPLALTVIGGMTIGTLVSLYFIPLAYWALYSRAEGSPSTS